MIYNPVFNSERQCEGEEEERNLEEDAETVQQGSRARRLQARRERGGRREKLILDPDCNFDTRIQL